MPKDKALMSTLKKKNLEIKLLNRKIDRLTRKVVDEPMTVEEVKLVNEYFKDYNKTQAYRRAYGDATPDAGVKARYAFERKGVRSAIQERMKEMMYNAEETQAKLQDIAEVNPDDFFDIMEDGEFKVNLAKAKLRGQLQHLRKLSYFRDGTLKNIELANPVDGLDRVAKTLKMFGDAPNAPIEKPINPLREMLDFIRASDNNARHSKGK